jgi:homoserine kinase type II
VLAACPADNGRVSGIGDLLSLWGIPVAAEVRRTNRGSNNTTFAVKHDGECWVFRVSQNLSAPQVAAEHRLLERLRRAGLPFAVPEPFAALDGRTVVETGEGPATVCRWLPGVPADLADPGMLERFGRACGHLSEALTDVPPQDAPHDWRGSSPLLVHPDVPGLPALCRELRRAGADTRPLETAARRVMEWWDTSREDLPVQVVHGDPAASNTLADPRSGRVTAILDFEFAGTDFRAQGIVVALYSSGALDGPGWKLRAAPLIAGFCSSARLSEREIRALPAMILWRSVGTVLWRAGRWRRGLDQTALIAGRIEDLVHTTDWIDHHGHALITLGLTRASR